MAASVGDVLGEIMQANQSGLSNWTAKWDIEPDLARLKHAHNLSKIDTKRAALIFEELAEAGSVMSMMYLGWMYHNQHRAVEKLEKAEYWYRRALECGYVPSTRLLGDVYRMMSKFDMALETFEIGDANNYLPATFRIGVMKFNGQGIPRDVSGAIEIWRRASRQGHLLSRRNLARAYISGRAGAGKIPVGLCIMLGIFRDWFRVYRDNPESELLR